jgi:predicted transcriptional regulator
MSSTLTIRLDPQLEKMLNQEARQSGSKRSELVRDMLRRHLALRKFERLRAQMLPRARKHGFITDEDVFRAIS